MLDLGILNRLDEAEIRKIWPLEAQDFSPWLAENVALLNEILGIQIEVQEQQGPVGPFRLDLAGTDSVSRRPVVIETQFGRSDHDHLGKLITYTAGRNAGIVIWVANGIRQPHRRAVDWLNTNSPPEIAFYGIELEVFRIDDSKPAVNFRVVSEPPPEKRKEMVSGEEISSRNLMYRDFFNKLRARLLDLQPNFTKSKALPQSWWSLGVGRSGFSLCAAFTLGNKFRIEIDIDTGVKAENETALEMLKEKASVIEDKVAQGLVWDPLPDKRATRVYVAIDGSIDQPENHDSLINWGAATMVKFRDAFSPLIKSLDLDGAPEQVS